MAGHTINVGAYLTNCLTSAHAKNYKRGDEILSIDLTDAGNDVAVITFPGGKVITKSLVSARAIAARYKKCGFVLMS